MKRREFLAMTAAIAVVPFAANASGFVAYTDGLVAQALARGETVFVDYSATWCGTCKAQERVMEGLMEEDAAYGKNITFIRVDWDTYKNAAITVLNEIPRRSTLIVLKGDNELGRIVAGTSKSLIKGLMDIALDAARA